MPQFRRRAVVVEAEKFESNISDRDYWRLKFNDGKIICISHAEFAATYEPVSEAPLIRDRSTPEGERIWNAVEEAASRAPKASEPAKPPGQHCVEAYCDLPKGHSGAHCTCDGEGYTAAFCKADHSQATAKPTDWRELCERMFHVFTDYPGERNDAGVDKLLAEVEAACAKEKR